VEERYSLDRTVPTLEALFARVTARWATIRAVSSHCQVRLQSPLRGPFRILQVRERIDWGKVARLMRN
jgi:hypothetical protein